MTFDIEYRFRYLAMSETDSNTLTTDNVVSVDGTSSANGMPVRSSSREVKYTEKVLEYELDRRQRNLKLVFLRDGVERDTLRDCVRVKTASVLKQEEEQDILLGDMTTITNHLRNKVKCYC